VTRFGIYVNPQTPGPVDDGRVIHEVLGQLELAESLGFEDAWLTEHHFTGYNTYSDPLIMGTAISQRTRKLNIGFSLAVAPFHNPIRFITQCNLLDQLSEGRLIIGIGPGNSPDEYRGFGRSQEERHAMIGAFANILETAYAAPPEGFSYESKWWSGSIRGRIIPAPYQQPRPQIAWATHTPSTIELLGKRGYSFLISPQSVEWVATRLKLYQRSMDAAGLDAAAKARAMFGTGVLRQIYVAEPGENWLETIGPWIDTFVHKSALANSGIDTLAKADFDQRKAGYLSRWIFAGTADELIDRLTPFVRFGVGHLMFWVNFGHLPNRLVRQTIERLATRVVPALRDVRPDPAFLATFHDEIVPDNE
jgi:alkanesulfonate monooxygenase SsuD/methylene tetrahydromethanopterin reductase-like flavin-dependent oxidoreductase (luciferase family)